MKLSKEVVISVIDSAEKVFQKSPVYTKNDYGGIEVFAYSKEYNRFQSLIRTDFALDFEWTTWTVMANSYLKNPNRLISASLTDIRKILTCHIKNEALENGHLAYIVDSGHLDKVIERLKVLAEAKK